MAKQQFDTLKSIRDRMLEQAKILESEYQERLKQQHKERELKMNEQFRGEMNRLGINIRKGRNQLCFKDFRLTVDIQGRLKAIKKCEKCGKEIQSNRILNMGNFASLIAGRYWAYHPCYPIKKKEEIKQAPTIEQLVFNKIEELFDIFYLEKDE